MLNQTNKKVYFLIAGLIAGAYFFLMAPPNQSKETMTSLFWVGESSDESNDFIANDRSYWDSFWLEHYGGIDSPEDRCGYFPCGFTPLENPFYFALPYGDRDENGNQKESVKLIPWYDQAAGRNALKNAWIKIEYQNRTCYAQWEDVGPSETDDFDYVFGDNEPKNSFGVSAGLDVSPAVWDCLGLETNAVTRWKFVDEKEVPEGPWKLIITRRGVSF